MAKARRHHAVETGAAGGPQGGVVQGGSSPTRLLTRHFLARFLYNDLLSPNGEGQASAGMVLAFLAVPGLWVLVGLVFAYSSPFLPPSGRLLLALGHKYQFIAVSMIVTALATALQWDALTLDRRDLANLGPLPLAPSQLFRAKALALLVFLSTFAITLNAIPSICFPAVWLSLVPIGLRRALQLTVAHAFITLSAAALAFFFVLGLHSLLLLVTGPRLFRRLSTLAQFVLVLALVTLFLLVPVGASRVRSSLASGGPAVYLSPPMWFLGAYEELTTPGLLGDPDLLAETKWRFWKQALRGGRGRATNRTVADRIVLTSEVDAREEYESCQPALDRLSGMAVLAWLIGVPSALVVYLVAHALHIRRLRETLVPGAPGGRLLRRALAALAMRVLIRHPVSQAGFFFTLQAFARSGTHRLYVAGSLALGFALVAVTTVPDVLGHSAPGPRDVPASLLALQMVLVFTLLVGLRAVIAVPAELRSNWLFQACWNGDLPRYLAGVRRATAFGLALPLLLALAPLHVARFGWSIAGWHLVVGWLAALALIDVMFLGCRKLPFTCSFVPRGTLKYTWPAYLLAFVLYAYGLAALERRAFVAPGGPVMLAASMMALLLALWVYRFWTRHHHLAVVFDEQPDEATVALRL